MDTENDLAALLAQCRETRIIKGATAELAAEVYRRYRLANLADQLEETFGPALLGREQLLVWLAGQIERIGARGVTDCDCATGLIGEAYRKTFLG